MITLKVAIDSSPEYYNRMREVLLVMELGLKEASLHVALATSLVNGTAPGAYGVAPRGEPFHTVDVDAPTAAEAFHAPAADAPPLTEAAPAAAIVPPEVDKNGLPWDTRIHSSNKALNDDGTWRKRRGVANATVTAVEAELRARPAGVAPPPPPPPPAATVAPPPPPTSAATVPGTTVTATDTTNVPAPPSAPVMTPVDDVPSFPAFMKKIAPLLASKDLKQTQLLTAIQNAGGEGVTSLASPAGVQLIPVVEAFLRAEGIALP